MTEKKIFKNAAEIIAVDDNAREEVWVAEWGTWVCVQGMTGVQRDAFEVSIQGEAGSGQIDRENLRAKLVSRCAIDPESGELLFSQDQVAALGAKNAAALQKVFLVARTLSGLSPEDIEVLEKNSESDQSDNSGSK